MQQPGLQHRGLATLKHQAFFFDSFSCFPLPLVRFSHALPLAVGWGRQIRCV